MELKPITNQYDYQQAQKYLESIHGVELSKEESNKISILTVLIEEFERKSKPVEEEIISETLIDYVYDLVINASKYEKHGLIERGLKLGEEYGELSAEILKLKGYKRTTEDEGRINYNILLESTDCLIMIFDIMAHMGFTKEQICDMAEKQVNKWLSGIKM
jgi:hypothetical protein